MKRFFLQNGVLFFISWLLLTSCMGEGRNVQSGSAFGVLRFDFKSAKNLLDVSDYDSFYSIRFQEANEGNCFWVVYEIDWDRPENSYESIEANGYLMVDILEKPDVDKWMVNPVLTDTSKILTGEVPLISPAMSGEWAYVKGLLFIISSLDIPTNQTMYWNLSFDRDNMVKDESGQRYFNVFLRTAVNIPGTYSKDRMNVANAFAIESYIKDVAKQVQEANGTSFKIRFNYPSSISESGKITWERLDSYDIPVEYILPKE